MYQHPEWDLPGVPKALIGQEPVPEGTPPAPPPPQPEAAAQNTRDIPSLIRLFQTDAYPLPEGQPVRIAVGKESSLTLHPNEEAVEYRQETPEHTIYLRAGKAGGLNFSFTPRPKPPVRHEPPTPSPQGAEPDTVPFRTEALPAPEPEPTAQGESPTPAQSPQDRAPDREKKERVVITGRVGREPTIKQIKTGVMAKFPVAEHQPDGGTTWHTIVAFGKTAEGLRGSLTKGRMVTVGGYPHQREVSGKAGQKRTITEIYLAGLKHHK
jgi:single-strand DNA-binding protein